MSTLVCDICGGVLNMESSGNFAICDSCGLRHSKERVKVKAQEINGVVEITKGKAEKERLLKNAETFLELGDVKKAEKLYEQITTDYPDDYRGWLGAFKCQFGYKNISIEDIFKAEDYENRIIKLGYNNLTDLYWESFFNERKTFKIIEKSHINKYKNVYSIIDDFSTELICYNTEELSPKLKELQSLIGEEYIKEFLNGGVLTFTTDRYNDFLGFWGQHLGFGSLGDEIKSTILKSLFEIGTKIAQEVETLNESTHKSFLTYIGITKNVENIKVVFLLGKTIVYLDYDEIRSYEIRECKKVIEEDTVNTFVKLSDCKTNKKLGLCQHCGGSFTGFFKKKCSKCGKEKDY